LTTPEFLQKKPKEQFDISGTHAIPLLSPNQINSIKAMKETTLGFYSARNARIASAVLATAIPSVCPSVCLSVRPSVRHTPVLCQNDGT